MNLTVVFDLDYTLFDAARFKEAMADALVPCGVTLEAFWSTYAETTGGAEGACDYDPERHVAALAPILDRPASEALARIDAVVADSSAYVFPGAKGLLGKLKADGARLVLLTHGNVEWQSRKVRASGLAEAFDAVHFTAGPKERSEALRAIEGDVVMVNDNGAEIDALTKAFPSFGMIAVAGPKPRPSDARVPVCGSLEEVYNALRARYVGWDHSLNQRQDPV